MKRVVIPKPHYEKETVWNCPYCGQSCEHCPSKRGWSTSRRRTTTYFHIACVKERYKPWTL